MGDCKTCTGCKEKKTKAEIEKPKTVEWAVVEMLEASHKKTRTILIIAIIIAICLGAIATASVHFGWLWYESQFETYEYSYEQDGEGTNIIGNDNEVDNGAEAHN